MRKPVVAHIIYSFLPVTQNWIYTQLRCNNAIDHHVISMMQEQTEAFPWQPRYTAFPPGRLTNFIGLLAARYWFRQPQRFMEEAVSRINPDLIHGHFSTESWRILSVARSKSLPLVTTFYGLDVDKLPRKRFWKKKYPALFSYGCRFLVEGPFMGKRLVSIGCPEDKIKVISLGVDRSLYTIRTRPDTEEIRILFVGLGREKKGPLDAARIFSGAVQCNKQLRLDVIGIGMYRRPFEKIVREAGVERYVTFHGNVSFDRYREVLANSSMVLVPSCYAADGDCEGGAPVVCIEAQVAAKPVVGTHHCDIPHVTVDRRSALLSDEHDVAAMVGSILKLAEDKELRERMGREGMKHTELHHDIYRQTEKITEVYRSVVKTSAGKSG